MIKKSTCVINIYGGPGLGKSTTSSYLYYLLKKDSVNAEMVREYVKDWAYEKRHITSYDQIYFLGKQARKESMLYGKVDYIINDSPLYIGLYYARKHCTKELADGVEKIAHAFYTQAASEGHKHHHVFLKRSKSYLSEGRFQTESEAKTIDIELKLMLTDLQIPFIECSTHEDDLKNLLESIKIINIH